MNKVLGTARKFLFDLLPEGLEMESTHKILTINLFSTTSFFFIFIFGLRNFSIGNYLLGWVCMIAALITSLGLFYLRFTKNYSLVSHALVLLALLFSLFLLIHGGEGNFVFIWLCTFPFLSLFNLGIKRGLIYTCFLLSLSILIFILPFDIFPTYSINSQIGFVSSFIVVTLMSIGFEYVRFKTYNELEKYRTQLDQIVKERTKELELAKKNAEESDKLKTSFLTNLSHKIRTPMNAIVGFSNLLLSVGIDDKLRKEMVDHIVSNSSVLLNLVDNIIDISKIESGQLIMNYNEVNIRNTVANIYNDFMESKAFSEKKHINLVFDLTNSPEISIISDEIRITQILRYLLENAFRFTEKGEILVGYTIVDNDNIKFYVKDTGIGIPKSMGNKIFDRFVTCDLNKHRIYRGNGIGLSICKSLVEMLGGTIDYESTLNVGSTFNFTLVSKPEKSMSSPIKLLNEFNWDNKTILIAEDEESNYKYLKHLLNKTHANIIWASNGQEAVDMASKNDVDLILMDIKMPIMNGLEATRLIKNLKKNIPIIAQTAFIYENDEKVSLNSGCDAYIAKPIGKNNLLDLMQRYMK